MRRWERLGGISGDNLMSIQRDEKFFVLDRTSDDETISIEGDETVFVLNRTSDNESLDDSGLGRVGSSTSVSQLINQSSLSSSTKLTHLVRASAPGQWSML